MSERLGHGVLGLLEGFAAIVYKLSEVALLGLGSRENTRLLDDVRGCFPCMEHAEFAGGLGFCAAYSLS